MPKPGTTKKLPVDDFDLAVLKARGITVETIRRNGLETHNDRLCIRYRDFETGELNGYCRSRFHTPRRGKDGKDIRYHTEKGSGVRPYSPAECIDDLRSGTGPVFITESEIKSLALAQLGYAVIGLSGVACWRKLKVLHPDIARLVSGRQVYIVFDYDRKITAKANVAREKRELTLALRQAGAIEVYDVRLPPGEDDEKQGVDDFVVANGAGAFAELVEQAPPMPAADGISSIYLICSSTPTLGQAARHGFAGRFLQAVERDTEATAQAILAHLPSTVAAYIGPGPHVWGGGEQPARVNSVIVGTTSGGRKGTSAKPVVELMKKADPAFWDKHKVSGLSTGEGVIKRLCDDKQDKRLLIIESEFARVLLQARREGNNLSAVLREGYDSGDLSLLTKVDPLLAKDAHVCLIGHITPAELNLRFSQLEQVNGFGNRLLWWYVSSDKMLPDAPPFDSKKMESFGNELKEIRDFARSLSKLDRDDSAAAMWRDIYAELRTERPGFIGALTARGESIVLRVALIYALLDKSRVITTQHLEAALAVWEYNSDSVRLLFKDNSTDSLADKLYKLLATGPMQMREFYTHVAEKSADIRSALSLLEEQGKVIREKLPRTGPGRPAEVYQRVPLNKLNKLK